MDWGNAIVKEINKDEDGSIKYLIGVLNLEGSVKATKLKITWLPHTNEPVPLSLMEFDYLITKKKETLYIHHGIQGDVADGKGVICKSDVDGVSHHGIQEILHVSSYTASQSSELTQSQDTVPSSTTATNVPESSSSHIPSHSLVLPTDVSIPLRQTLEANKM
ncbi:hypothetical protein POM88_040380 [Heracleum sosnowskyi]|uniref:Uncharacterized protein n=1 Tax=Heracleum sosnowskyi TaxID=360622 RepID=A0AAD8M9R8_9APIA|nr:hypothetical protein POM88_040380 [Heracleum sosnowskyi]